MRVAEKTKLIQAIRDIQKKERLFYAKENRINAQERLILLANLQEEAIALGNLLEIQGKQDIVTMLEQYCEELYKCSTVIQDEDILYAKYEELHKISEDIATEILAISAKMKIAFFPYKISMWDTLESIWETAKRDMRCECQLVPIPYYVKNAAGEIEEERYEGDKFPTGVIDYKKYFPEQEKPDIMYIHNPYDQYNKITMIEPRFFSSELKKTDGILVYVPYYMMGCCMKYESMVSACGNMGSVNSNYIVVQNENLKKAYEYCGFPAYRILALGSPKIDAVYKIEKKTYSVMENWQEVLKGRKVILLNTSISTCIQSSDWLEYIRGWIEPILEDKRLALIWRPHPLLLDTIHTMMKDDNQYEALLEYIVNAPNAVIDDSDTPEAAVKVSDAMISDYSSLVLQYTFTGKPTYVLTGKSELRKGHVFCDYFSNYFKEDGYSIEDFLIMVLAGEDPKKEERLRYARESVINSDGSCGKFVHQILYEKATRRMEE